MIVSVHLADVGLLQTQLHLFRRLDPSTVPGMTYAEPTFTAPLGERLPRPRPGRIGLIAAWEDDAALDRFLASDPFGARLAAGWHARLEPRRCFGSWPGMPGLPTKELPVDDDEPVAVLTLGRLRFLRTRPFLQAGGPAEREAVANPAMLASTGLARLARPRLVSTFSIWRSAGAMREYAFAADGAHQAAVRADRARPFHHASAFIRFRPYASQGSWDGRDPLSGAAPAAV
jgi:hypothetical protein